MKKIVRVTVPRNAAKLIVLALNIIAKHLADGASSILNLLNMADMQTKTDIANVQNKLSDKKSKDAETATEDRDLVLGSRRGGILTGTVLYYIMAVRDVLLGVYKGNEHHLGDWSFEVNTSIAELRVVIPTHAPEQIALAKGILAKHQADGAASPLSYLNMADFLSKTEEAEIKHNLSKTLRQQSELAIQTRDLAIGHAREQTSYTPHTLLFYISSARDVLLGLYRGDERELGDWGFNVVMSTPSPSSKKKAE